MDDNYTGSVLNTLATYKNIIDQAIAVAFNDYEAYWKSQKTSLYSMEALGYLREFSTRPGKRLRGALAWYIYQALANKPKDQTGINLAVAMELIQNYFLIIDDVVDRSAMRRGQPAVHVLYSKKYKDATNDNHLGNMLAIFIGSLAQHLANDVILSCKELPEKITSSLKLLHENVIKTCFGQIDDMLSVYNEKTISKETIYKIYEAKSSYYTFINPMQIGMAMAGYDDQKIFESIKGFGIPAGIAFQLKDDLLGMFGDSTETGKPNIDDLREGKQTLLVAYTNEMTDKRGRDLLEAALGNQTVTAKDHKAVCKIMVACGAKARVESEAKKATLAAKKAITNIPIFDKNTKLFYSGIVDYVISRTG
ncbi:MAG TPA: polyprenyl synthetase family protein [Patescibacteria group bacterium]|nr:polyprenyl synthetase family protein [Patescibacteria group bacterium]